MLISPVASIVATALAFLPTQIGAVDIGPELIEVAGMGHIRTIPCEGRRVEVQGTGHALTFTGVCSGLELSGANNFVTITLSPNAVLDISGSGQAVRWRSSGEPRQSLSGANNSVVRVRD
ncbi:DUF3060 domain-containing protein [Brevundimonas diminuta]|uniref:DUF3060 domain-containing protein n=1 Tax=Brevundimonas diminuta TaxID=293 RepID=UPI0032095991